MAPAEYGALCRATWAEAKARLRGAWDKTKRELKAGWAAQKAQRRAQRQAIAAEFRAGWTEKKAGLKADRKSRVKELRAWWTDIKADLKAERKEKADDLRAGWKEIKVGLKAKWRQIRIARGKLVHVEILQMRAEWSQAAKDYRAAWAAEQERYPQAWLQAIKDYRAAWTQENEQYRATWKKAIADYRAAWAAEMKRRQPEWPKALADYKAAWAKALEDNKNAWALAYANYKACWEAEKLRAAAAPSTWEWRRVVPERVTRAGAMPGELWDPNLHKYILSPVREVRSLIYYFTDGTSHRRKLRPSLGTSEEYLRLILEAQLKKTVDHWDLLLTYQEYKKRVPPVPGPVAWPKWKQRPEDWKEVSQEDLFTPGKIPDAMWSDRLGRYILPTMPRIVYVLQAWRGNDKLFEFLMHYPGTHHADRILNERIGPRWTDWTHYTLVRQYFRYKAQPYEKSGERRFNLPFELTEIVDEEFERKKFDYNARYGYAVEMPDWGDIFHYRVPVTMSAEEKLLIKTRQMNLIPEPRRSELMDERARRKIRIRRAMESPTPEVIRAIGSYSTMVDNAQDTLVTAAMLARIGIKLFPKFARRIAPVYGIAATGADILNVMALFTLLPMIAKSLKRGHFTWSSLNPFSKEMRLRRAAKMLQWKPTWGDIIQALQVSDSVCGFGICLGPLVGWYEDYVAGEVRDARGEKVKWSPGAERMRKYMRLAAATLFHMPMIATGGQTMTDDDHLAMLYATLGAIRTVAPAWTDEDSVAIEPDPTSYMVKAPQPKDPLTIDVLQELGVDIEATSVWPTTGKQWSSIDELTELPRPAVMDNLRALILRNNKTERGILIGGLINQISAESLSLYGGEHQVEIKDAAETRVAHNLLLSQNYLPYNVTPDQVEALAHWIHTYDQMYNETPPTPEVLKIGREIGILWRNTLPDRPVGKAAEIWPDYLELKEKYKEDSLLS